MTSRKIRLFGLSGGGGGGGRVRADFNFYFENFLAIRVITTKCGEFS